MEEIFNELQQLVRGLEERALFLENEVLKKQNRIDLLKNKSINDDWELIENQEILEEDELLGMEESRKNKHEHQVGCFWIAGDDRFYTTRHFLKLNSSDTLTNYSPIEDNSNHMFEISNKYYTANVMAVCSAEPPKNMQAALLTFSNQFNSEIANYFASQLDKTKTEVLLCLLTNPNAEENNFSGTSLYNA